MKKISSITVIVIVFLIFLSCAMPLDKTGEVKNFDDYINNLTKYGYEDNEEEIIKIENYSPLFFIGFDYALPFNGEYTFAIKDKTNLLLKYDGYVYNFESNLVDFNLVNDHYIFIENNLKGVKNIFGQTVIDASYNSIEILDNLILCKDGLNRYTLYKDYKILILNSDSDINLAPNNLIVIDGIYYNQELNEFKIRDNKVIAVINENTYIIKYNSKYGLYDSVNDIYFYPNYDNIINYSNGYLVVVEDNFYKIINSNIKEVYKSYIREDSKKPIVANKTSILFLNNSSYGVMDYNGDKITQEEFNFVDYSNFNNGYLIIGDEYKQFALVTKDNDFLFLTDNYKQIQSLDNEHFITRCINNKFSLLDKDLKPLIEDCTNITYSRERLLVERNEQFYYYY